MLDWLSIHEGQMVHAVVSVLFTTGNLGHKRAVLVGLDSMLGPTSSPDALSGVPLDVLLRAICCWILPQPRLAQPGSIYRCLFQLTLWSSTLLPDCLTRLLLPGGCTDLADLGTHDTELKSARLCLLCLEDIGGRLQHCVRKAAHTGSSAQM